MSEPNSHGHEVPLGPSPVPEAVLKTGHEPDKFDTKSILAIPLAVLGFFIIGFGVTTAVFIYIMSPSEDKSAHPLAVKANEADLNTRMGRINDPNGDVRQPRLEALRMKELNNQSLNFTSQAIEGGSNSPEFHPEDLRPTAAYAQKNGLTSYGVANEAEKTVQIPIDVAIELAAKNAKVLPSLEGENAVNPKSLPLRPKISNGGGQPLPSVGNK